MPRSIKPAMLAMALAAAPGLAAAMASTAQDGAVDPPTETADGADKQTRNRRHVTELDGIVVHAVPGQRGADALVAPVAVLHGAALDAAAGSTLGATVARIPGVQTTALGAAVGRPVIRGMDGPRVAITEGWIGSADVSTLSQDHAVALEPFLADQIEVLKGPSTLLHGAGAVGGVVNLEDGRIPERAPARGVEGRTQFAYDGVSRGRTGMFRLDGGEGAVALHADGLQRRLHDYRTPAGVLANSGLRTSTGALGASFVGERGYLGVAVSRFLDAYGSPAEPGDPAAGEPSVHIGMAQTRHDLKGALRDPVPGIDRLELGAGRTAYRHTEFAGDAAETTFANRATEARLLATHASLGGWRGSFGVHRVSGDFAAFGEEAFVPATRTRALGVFAVEAREWGPLRVELGARVDRQTSEPQAAPRAVFRPRSYSAGLRWQVDDAWRLKLNLDRSQRAPAAEELFAHGPHAASATFEIGDRSLGVETANQVELGMHYRSRRVDASVSAYANRFDDFIYLADAGAVADGLPVRTWTHGNARFRGLEGEVAWHLVDAPEGHWDLRVFGDRVRATLGHGAGNVPRIPAARFGSGLVWNRGDLRASVEAVRYFKQDRVAAYETDTAGFTLVDAHLAWTFHNGGTMQWQAFADGHNLANQTARLATSLFKDVAPLPGRNVSFGIRGWF